MPTGIDDLWAAMDEVVDAGKTDASGWLLRLARPAAGCPLFAAIELASRRRAILLRLPADAVPSRRRWPRCKGLVPLALKIEGKEHFGVALKEDRFADVFTVLAEDLARQVSEAITPAEQARMFLGQLSRWQKFLTASTEGLTEEEQRGLWGELRFLRDRLLPVLGFPAVAGWKGAEQEHQDFQFESGAIEVKTTLAKQPQIVRITSERQLDDSAWPILILYVIALEVRDGGGETLPGVVRSLRVKLIGDPAAREQLEEGLLQVGYFDAHATRYVDRGYHVRSEIPLHVRQGFPRLAERDMPPGVGNVNYGLAISACTSFSMSGSKLKNALVDIIKPSNQQKGKNNG